MRHHVDELYIGICACSQVPANETVLEFYVGAASIAASSLNAEPPVQEPGTLQPRWRQLKPKIR
jgi:hypothetical protein